MIIPAYCAEREVLRCIEALRKAGFSTAEIVLVDDASLDGTVNCCRDAGIEPLVLRENRGAAEARNMGVRATESEILFFVDADVAVHDNVRRIVLDFMAAHPGVAAMFGAYDDRPDHPARISRIRNLLHSHVHQENAGDAVTFWTGCGAVRREDFLAVGGFGPEPMADVRFGMELAGSGRKIRLVPALQGTHLKYWSLTRMIKTDLMCRAVPWARLLRSPLGARLPESLNVNLTSKRSVVAVATSLTGLVLVVSAPTLGLLVMALSIAFLALINRKFLVKVKRLGGWSDAFVAFVVLWIHYFVGGLGFAWVRSGLDDFFRSARRRNAN